MAKKKEEKKRTTSFEKKLRRIFWRPTTALTTDRPTEETQVESLCARVRSGSSPQEQEEPGRVQKLGGHLTPKLPPAKLNDSALCSGGGGGGGTTQFREKKKLKEEEWNTSQSPSRELPDDDDDVNVKVTHDLPFPKYAIGIYIYFLPINQFHYDACLPMNEIFRYKCNFRRN